MVEMCSAMALGWCSVGQHFVVMLDGYPWRNCPVCKPYSHRHYGA